MRGYAPSTLSGPFHAERLAHDLIDVADALSPGVPVRVVGHDWGAVAVYAALMLAPERFVAAVTMAVPHPGAFLRNLWRLPAQLRRSWYMFFFQLPWISDRAVEANDYALIDRLWKAWSPGWTPPAGYMEELKSCLRASMPAPIQYYRALRRRPMRMRRIPVPTLHLHGANDGCIAAEAGRGQERWFSGRFDSRVIHGAGHFLHLERPDEVGRQIAGWMTDPALASRAGGGETHPKSAS